MDNSLPVCMKRLSFFNICVSPTIVVRRKIFPEFSLFLVNARYHSIYISKVLATALQMFAGIYGESTFCTCKNDRETLYRGKPQ